MKDKAYNLKDYKNIFAKYDINLFNQNIKESKKVFKNFFLKLENKDKENYSLFSHIFNLQVDVDELKKSVEKYKKEIKEISGNKKEQMAKRQLNFDNTEVKQN